jgi:hypothetical protein
MNKKHKMVLYAVTFILFIIFTIVFYYVSLIQTTQQSFFMAYILPVLTSLFLSLSLLGAILFTFQMTLLFLKEEEKKLTPKERDLTKNQIAKQAVKMLLVLLILFLIGYFIS